MGIRINVLFDHDLADFTDQAATLTRLASTTHAALAVRDYWLAADPTSRHDNVQTWQAEPELNRLPKYLGYTGPGSLFLTVTHRAARITRVEGGGGSSASSRSVASTFWPSKRSHVRWEQTE